MPLSFNPVPGLQTMNLPVQVFKDAHRYADTFGNAEERQNGNATPFELHLAKQKLDGYHQQLSPFAGWFPIIDLYLSVIENLQTATQVMQDAGHFISKLDGNPYQLGVADLDKLAGEDQLVSNADIKKASNILSTEQYQYLKLLQDNFALFDADKSGFLNAAELETKPQELNKPQPGAPETTRPFPTLGELNVRQDLDILKNAHNDDTSGLSPQDLNTVISQMESGKTYQEVRIGLNPQAPRQIHFGELSNRS